MKKFLFVAACFLAVCGANANSGSAPVAQPSEVTTHSDGEWRTITVYKLTQVGSSGAACSKQTKSAEFNQSSMELKVDGRTRSVGENRAYGQENDYRAPYKYQSEYTYFFNL